MSNAACAFGGPRRAWEDEATAGFSDGVAVRPSRRTEGCSDKACYSWAGGSVSLKRWGMAGGIVACRHCLGDAGGEGNPALSTNSTSVSRENSGTAMNRPTEERLRRTPTWHAKCQIQGSTDPRKVRTLGCVRRT